MQRSTVLLSVGIILSLLCLFFSMTWYYYLAIFIGIPLGFLAYFIWHKLKKEKRKIHLIIPILLIFSAVLFFFSLINWVFNLLAIDGC